MFKNKEKILVHFIGIGGIGMSGIANILLSLGYKVSGSDLKSSEITESLIERGATIFIGHDSKNISQDTTVVVYSTAIDLANPEIQKAQELKVPLIRRAEMLTELMRLKYGIAIAGTHGKTTTSSILATLLHECGLDPTHVIGGVVANLGGNSKLGKSDFLVAEADESDGTFLLLNPVLSVVTNIDNDHLDFYKTEENIFNAFVEFSNKVPFYGFNSFNIHDENIQKLIKQTKKPYLTFGIDIEADYVAKNIRFVDGASVYDLYFKGEKISEVTLNLMGNHNVLNSLGAISIAHQLEGDLVKVANSVQKFSGVGRRFERLFRNDSIEIVDDYGHHPTEVLKTLETAKSYKGDDLIVIFEPHRYTRTKDCWKEFVTCFKGIDNVHILPIYAASEEPIEGINSENLVKEIQGAKYLNNWGEAEKLIDSLKSKNAFILTLGAGAIGRDIRNYVKKLES